MEQKPEAHDWYAKNSSGDQGIVIDANTGRTVAVAYEARDTAILAAAPDMLEGLERLADLYAELERITRGTDLGCHPDARNFVACIVSTVRAAKDGAEKARAAIAKATGN